MRFSPWHIFLLLTGLYVIAYFYRISAAKLLLLTAVGFIVGRPLAGRLSDGLASRKKVLIVRQLGLFAEVSQFLGLIEWLTTGPLRRLWLGSAIFYVATRSPQKGRSTHDAEVCHVSLASVLSGPAAVRLRRVFQGPDCGVPAAGADPRRFAFTGG